MGFVSSLELSSCNNPRTLWRIVNAGFSVIFPLQDGTAMLLAFFCDLVESRPCPHAAYGLVL